MLTMLLLACAAPTDAAADGATADSAAAPSEVVVGAACEVVSVRADGELELDWSGLTALADGTPVSPDEVTTVILSAVDVDAADVCDAPLTQANVLEQRPLPLGDAAAHRVTWSAEEGFAASSVGVLSLSWGAEGGGLGVVLEGVEGHPVRTIYVR